MDFNADKAIYVQMADRLSDEILAGTYPEEGRIPSVREYAVLLQVNVNTAMKAYDKLSRDNIIFNRRGLGYFVSPGAKERILADRRREFMEVQLPALFRNMRLLGLGIDTINLAWEKTASPPTPLQWRGE